MTENELNAIRAAALVDLAPYIPNGHYLARAGRNSRPDMELGNYLISKSSPLLLQPRQLAAAQYLATLGSFRTRYDAILEAITVAVDVGDHSASSRWINNDEQRELDARMINVEREIENYARHWTPEEVRALTPRPAEIVHPQKHGDDAGSSGTNSQGGVSRLRQPWWEDDLRQKYQDIGDAIHAERLRKKNSKPVSNVDIAKEIRTRLYAQERTGKNRAVPAVDTIRRCFTGREFIPASE